MAMPPARADFHLRLLCLLPVAVMLLAGAAQGPARLSGHQETRSAQARAGAAYGRLPLTFEPNRGQAAPGVRFEARSLAEAPEVGRAHAAFYDAAYFATKKGEPTRKYRRLVARERAPDTHEAARCEVITAGPSAHAIAAVDRFLTAAGPEPRARPEDARRLDQLVFRNAVGFEARFDGHSLAIEPDAKALAASGSVVAQAFAQALGDDFFAGHRGALLYLTKYFTPHPPGEPHFFVKPWAFTRTPPGWSSLLEGAHGEGWDVMRGVISTDVFFATPAVFWVHRLGAPIRVPAGEPLLRVIPIPRRLLRAGYREVRWRDEEREEQAR
jgi:hypothetical protein